MFTCFIKRVLPFVLTLIFGIGLGSIFGGANSQRTGYTPSYTPTQNYTYKGCTGRHRSVDNSTPSQNRQSSENQTRTEPFLSAQ